MGNPLIFSCLCSLQALSVTSGTLKRQLIHDKQSPKNTAVLTSKYKLSYMDITKRTSLEHQKKALEKYNITL